MKTNLDSMVKQAYHSSLDTGNVAQGVREVDGILGGIKSVTYKNEGRIFKIRGNLGDCRLPGQGLKNKYWERSVAFAALAYEKAKANGFFTEPGEVHAAHGISSKHYKGPFYDLIQEYSA